MSILSTIPGGQPEPSPVEPGFVRRVRKTAVPVAVPTCRAVPATFPAHLRRSQERSRWWAPAAPE
ncbi:hypothetical protein GCM10020229_25190 [Kitasatospora albolonga]